MQQSSPAIARSAEVVRISRRARLLEASGDDVFVRCALSLDERVDGLSTGRSVAWFTESHRRRGTGWLNVVAADDLEAVALLIAAAESYGQRLSGVTVSASALPLLPVPLRPVEFNLWDWFSTAAAPPPQPGEEAVGWATDDDVAGIVHLLETDSPRHSARPGDDDVLRWCVVRDHDHDQRLVACAALTEHVPGVAHLASIVTRSDQRGRGLGRAVTAWLTRRLLEDGAPVVTLGMYADNEVARRLYRDLGYVDSHHFASGYLPGRRSPGDADPVHDEAD